MYELTDPRPMEPDWVIKGEPSGIIEWRSTRTQWNKELKKTDVRIEYHEGYGVDLLRYISSLTVSPAFEPVVIDFNASQSTGHSLTNKLKALNYSEYPVYFWKIEYHHPDYTTPSEESGTDIFELLDWMASLIEDGTTGTLELDYHDPTPEYMEIGSMF